MSEWVGAGWWVGRELVGGLAVWLTGWLADWLDIHKGVNLSPSSYLALFLCLFCMQVSDMLDDLNNKLCWPILRRSIIAGIIKRRLQVTSDEGGVASSGGCR